MSRPHRCARPPTQCHTPRPQTDNPRQNSACWTRRRRCTVRTYTEVTCTSLTVNARHSARLSHVPSPQYPIVPSAGGLWLSCHRSHELRVGGTGAAKDTPRPRQQSRRGTALARGAPGCSAESVECCSRRQTFQSETIVASARTAPAPAPPSARASILRSRSKSRTSRHTRSTCSASSNTRLAITPCAHHSAHTRLTNRARSSATAPAYGQFCELRGGDQVPARTRTSSSAGSAPSPHRWALTAWNAGMPAPQSTQEQGRREQTKNPTAAGGPRSSPQPS